MNTIFEDFLSAWKADPRARLVVPSEIAAKSWRRALSARVGVLPEEVVQSWDRVAQGNSIDRVKSVTPLIVNIFIHDLLLRNKKDPFLHDIVVPAHREHSGTYAPIVAQVIRALGLLHQKKGVLQKFAPLLKRDIEIIDTMYRGFLAAHSLTDPYLTPMDSNFDPNIEYHLLYPALFSSYHWRIPPNAAAIEIPPIRETEGRQFPTMFEEFEYILNRIEQLLCDGVSTHDIVITLGSVEQYVPYLLSGARRRAIPLTIQHGKLLAEFAVGRLFTLCDALTATDFEFETLQELLLAPDIPWQEREKHREIAACCVRYGILAGYNMIVRKLPAGTRDYFKNLGLTIRAITRASTALQLYTGVTRFFRQYFRMHDDDVGWNNENMPVWKLLFSRITGIVQIERQLNFPCADPFSLLLFVVRSMRYTAEPSFHGIAVYDYPQSVGIAAPYHFLLGMSHQNIYVQRHTYEFLDEMEQIKYALPKQDISHEMRAAYSHSGGVVWVSGSVETPRGRANPIGPLFDAESKAVPEAASFQRTQTRYTEELEFWKGGASFPPALYPVQKKFAEPICPRFPTHDYTIDIANKEGIHEQIYKMLRGDGGFTLSATKLNCARHCPFDFFLRYALRLSNEQYEMSPDDPLLVGGLYHQVLCALYRYIAEEDGGLFIAAKEEEYFGAGIDILNEQLVRRTGYRPIQEGLRMRAMEIIRRVLKFDREYCDGFEIAACELPVQKTILDIHMEGKIDRLMRNPETHKYIIIDYKKNKIPRRVDVVGNEKKEPLVDVQMVCYIDTITAPDCQVESAWYVSLEGGDQCCVFADAQALEKSNIQRAKPYLDSHSLDHVGKIYLTIIEDIVNKIKQGDFRSPDPFLGCSSCAQKGICRKRFYATHA